MSKSKLTLIIDGNWLLMSRVSVLLGRFDDLELRYQLQLLLTKSIKLVLKQFPQIDNIIFIADGGSWRNSLPIPDYLLDENGNKISYKGNRERDDEINWDLIFNAYEEYIEILKQNGINAYREKDIEGDDWAWWWSTQLNNQGTNCIIWSKDNDLKQLVNINSDKCFTAWWNADTGLFIKNYKEEEFDFLFNMSFNENEQIWEQCEKYAKVVNKIDPSIIIIDKIIKGDVSDNILPIILRTSKSNSSKKFKVSTKDINYQLNILDNKEVNAYIHNLVNSKNYVNRIDNNKSEKDILEHFSFNKQLIVLQKDSYPKEILNILEESNHAS